MKTLLADCLKQTRIPVQLEDNQEYLQVKVSLNGRGVSLRQKVLGTEVKTKNQFFIRAGQFIYSRIDARNGAMGIVPPDLDGAIVTGDFPVFEVNNKILDPTFFTYLTSCRAFIETCKQASRGVTNRKRLKEAELLSISVDLPDLGEQKRLSSHLTRIERRMNTAADLCSQLSEEQDDLLYSLISEITKDAPLLPLNEVAPLIRRKVKIENDVEYPELGIRSFGKGTFHKPAIKGSELGNKELYEIHPGDLLVSQVFAWEGAVAVVQPENKGRFGSHRFVTCLCDTSRVLANYLRTYFLTPTGLAQLRSASKGAAGRNKPLSIPKFQRIEVPIPSIEKQLRYNEIHELVFAARKLNAQTATELETLMPSVLDRAFKGEL
ncbi:MAG: restriction endonuclease subunit S [Nitrospirae bacterium]|nr:restriction endonuclease subunit S [Nitrospirota bacterium]MDA8338993.1 restriction endonuclease subunit S [Nitrospiraceae bacterium]